jgi:hypothetical protein
MGPDTRQDENSNKTGQEIHGKREHERDREGGADHSSK